MFERETIKLMIGIIDKSVDSFVWNNSIHFHSFYLLQKQNIFYQIMLEWKLLCIFFRIQLMLYALWMVKLKICRFDKIVSRIYRENYKDLLRAIKLLEISTNWWRMNHKSGNAETVPWSAISHSMRTAVSTFRFGNKDAFYIFR